MAKCSICHEDCVIIVEQEEDDDGQSATQETIPDDVILPCQCHFHWQCLLDESAAVLTRLHGTRPACLVCGSSIVVDGRIPVTYLNEGGLQENLDMLPAITEEAFLSHNPTHRPARAFLTMCAEGDVAAMGQFITDYLEEEDPDEMPVAAIVRYQDSLNGGKTGLHLAVENQRLEAMCLMLWLGSHIKDEHFPSLADSFLKGVSRTTTMGPDIRTLLDSQGRTAATVAANMIDSFEDSQMRMFLEGGVLSEGYHG